MDLQGSQASATASSVLPALEAEVSSLKSIAGTWVVYYTWDDRKDLDLTVVRYLMTLTTTDPLPDASQLDTCRVAVGGECVLNSGPGSWNFFITGTLKGRSLCYKMLGINGEEIQVKGRYDWGNGIANGCWYVPDAVGGVRKGGKLIAYRKGFEPKEPTQPDASLLTDPSPPAMQRTSVRPKKLRKQTPSAHSKKSSAKKKKSKSKSKSKASKSKSKSKSKKSKKKSTKSKKSKRIVEASVSDADESESVLTSVSPPTAKKKKKKSVSATLKKKAPTKVRSISPTKQTLDFGIVSSLAKGSKREIAAMTATAASAGSGRLLHVDADNESDFDSDEPLVIKARQPVASLSAMPATTGKPAKTQLLSRKRTQSQMRQEMIPASMSSSPRKRRKTGSASQTPFAESSTGDIALSTSEMAAVVTEQKYRDAQLKFQAFLQNLPPDKRQQTLANFDKMLQMQRLQFESMGASQRMQFEMMQMQTLMIVSTFPAANSGPSNGTAANIGMDTTTMPFPFGAGIGFGAHAPAAALPLPSAILGSLAAASQSPTGGLPFVPLPFAMGAPMPEAMGVPPISASLFPMFVSTSGGLDALPTIPSPSAKRTESGTVQGADRGKSSKKKSKKKSKKHKKRKHSKRKRKRKKNVFEEDLLQVGKVAAVGSRRRNARGYASSSSQSSAGRNAATSDSSAPPPLRSSAKRRGVFESDSSVPSPVSPGAVDTKRKRRKRKEKMERMSQWASARAKRSKSPKKKLGLVENSETVLSTCFSLTGCWAMYFDNSNAMQLPATVLQQLDALQKAGSKEGSPKKKKKSGKAVDRKEQFSERKNGGQSADEPSAKRRPKDAVYLTHIGPTEAVKGYLNSIEQCQLFGHIDSLGDAMCRDVYMVMIWNNRTEVSGNFAGFVTILYGKLDGNDALHCEYASFSFIEEHVSDVRSHATKEAAQQYTGAIAGRGALVRVAYDLEVINRAMAETIDEINQMNFAEYFVFVKQWLLSKAEGIRKLQPASAAMQSDTLLLFRYFTEPFEHAVAKVKELNQCVWQRYILPETDWAHISYAMNARKTMAESMSSRRLLRRWRKRVKETGNEADTEASGDDLPIAVARRRSRSHSDDDADDDSDTFAKIASLSPKTVRLNERNSKITNSSVVLRDYVFCGDGSADGCFPDYLADESNRAAVISGVTPFAHGDLVEVRFSQRYERNCGCEMDTATGLSKWHRGIVMSVFRQQIRVRFLCADVIFEEWIDCKFEGVLQSVDSSISQSVSAIDALFLMTVRPLDVPRIGDDLDAIISDLHRGAMQSWRRGLCKGEEVAACDLSMRWLPSRVLKRKGVQIKVAPLVEPQSSGWLSIASKRVVPLHVSDMPHRFKDRMNLAHCTVNRSRVEDDEIWSKRKFPVLKDISHYCVKTKFFGSTLLHLGTQLDSDLTTHSSWS